MRQMDARIAEAYPGAFLPDLAVSLGTLGQVHASAGDHALAASTFEEGLTLIAPFVEDHRQAFEDLAKALAAGDLTQNAAVSATHVEVRSRDEIGQMAADFNQMIDGLQETGTAFAEMSSNLRDSIGQVQSAADGLAMTSQQLGAGGQILKTVSGLPESAFALHADQAEHNSFVDQAASDALRDEFLLSGAVRAIRKDAGNPIRDLPKGELLRLFVNDSPPHSPNAKAAQSLP